VNKVVDQAAKCPGNGRLRTGLSEQLQQLFVIVYERFI